MSEHHTILGDKVHVYKRTNSSIWQCATYLAGKNRRTTSKGGILSKARVRRRLVPTPTGKLRDGELKDAKSFREAAKVESHPLADAMWELVMRRQFPAAVPTLHLPGWNHPGCFGHRIRAATARSDPVRLLYTDVCKGTPSKGMPYIQGNNADIA